MSLLTVIINKFCAVESAVYSFNSGFTHLSGPSQVGKTTIFKAISWALYCEPDNVAPRHNHKLKTEVILKIPRDYIIITRRREVKELIVEYKSIKYTDEHAQSIIVQLYGTYNVWLASCYMDQFSVTNKLQSLKSSEKLEFLEELFLMRNTGMESGELKALDNKMQEDLKNLESKYKALDARAVQIEQTLSKYKPYEEINYDYDDVAKQYEEIKIEYRQYQTALREYNQYLNTKAELEEWLKKNSNLSNITEQVSNYHKWEKAKVLIGELSKLPDLQLEDIDSQLTLASNMENFRQQKLKYDLTNKIAALSSYDVNELSSKVTDLKARLIKHNNAVELEVILNRYRVESPSDLYKLLEQEDKLSKALSLAGTKDNLVRLLAMPDGIEQQIIKYGQANAYRHINIEDQELALLQQKYKSVYQKIKPHVDLFETVEELLLTSTPMEIRMASHKLICPHCEGHVYLDRDTLVKISNIQSNDTIAMLAELRPDIPLQEVYDMFKQTVTLQVKDSNDLSRIKSLIQVKDPGYTIDEYKAAMKIKEIAPDPNITLHPKLSKDVLRARQIANNIQLDDTVAEELEGIESLLKQAIEDNNLRKLYTSQMPQIDITLTPEELNKSLEQTYDIASLIKLRELKVKLQEIGTVNPTSKPKYIDKADELQKTYNAKLYNLQHLKEVSNPGDDTIADYYKELESIITLKPMFDLVKPLVDEYNSVCQEFDEVRDEFEISRSMYYIFDMTKRNIINNRLNKFNKLLESKASKLAEYIKGSLTIRLNSFTQTKKGDKTPKPEIIIVHSGIKTSKPEDLCGIEVKLVGLVIAMCLNSFNRFPLLMLDEALTFTDDSRIDPIIELIKQMLDPDCSIVMTIHRANSKDFDNIIEL